MDTKLEQATMENPGTDRGSADWNRAIVAFLFFPASLWLVNWVSHSSPTNFGQVIFLVLFLLVVAVVSIFVHAFLWFHLGSIVLGAGGTFVSSIRAVGTAFFHPALAGVALAIVAKLLFMFADTQHLGSTLRGAKLLIFLWALVNVVRYAKRINAFTTIQVGLFIAWLGGILLVGLLVFGSLF